MVKKVKRLPYLNLLKVLIGLALLVISLRGVDWDQLKQSVDQINLIWLLVMVGLVMLGLFLKIVRWVLFLRNYGIEVRFSRAVEAFFLGQAANILLPTRGGEVLRLAYLSVDQPASVPQITATIALEKFLDLIAITCTALGVAAYLPPERAIWARGWLLPLSLLAITLLSVAILWGPQIWGKVRSRISKWSNAWMRGVILMVDKFVESSLWLRDVSHLIPAVTMTLLIWAVMWLTNIALFYGLALQVPFMAGGLVLVLVYIGVLPALMPGNVGPFYFFAQLGVTPFGVPPENALAFAILLHAVVTLTPLVASGVSLLFSESVRNIILKSWESR